MGRRACRLSAPSATAAPPTWRTPPRRGRRGRRAGKPGQKKEMLSEHLGKPLTRVPDPFGTHESFGAHNNARLRAFLDTFGLDYECASSTDYHTTGRFDAALLRVLERIDEVMAVMLPSLREERAASYSPFL